MKNKETKKKSRIHDINTNTNTCDVIYLWARIFYLFIHASTTHYKKKLCYIERSSNLAETRLLFISEFVYSLSIEFISSRSLNINAQPFRESKACDEMQSLQWIAWYRAKHHDFHASIVNCVREWPISGPINVINIEYPSTFVARRENQIYFVDRNNRNPVSN